MGETPCRETYKAAADLLKLADLFEVEDIFNRVQGSYKSACLALMQGYKHRYKAMKKIAATVYKALSKQKFVQMKMSF